jgi:cobalt-zinc-cadmium efflux system protein
VSDRHDHAHAHGHDHGHGHDARHGSSGGGLGPPPSRPPPGRSATHDHGHDHGHTARAAGESRLAFLLGLVSVYIVVEAVGGLLAGSLALLADASHMVSDAAALAITLWAMRMARRPATPERTYGWHRAEILAAAVNGGALVAISLGILWEAIQRWGHPHPVDGPSVVAIAVGGGVVNLVGMALLHAGRDSNLNMRGAWLHMVSDTLGSVGAVLAGLGAWKLGWTWADPLASVAIALLVLRSAWSLLDDAVHVLMENAPAHIDTNDVRATLAEHPGVVGVHDLHVWTITSDMIAMSGHVVAQEAILATPGGGTALLRELAERLRARFGIDHATLQVEPEGFDAHPELHP